MMRTLRKIRRTIKQEKIDDPYSRTQEEIRQSNFSVSRGESIAIAVGSRGIANLSAVVKGVVDTVRSLGGKPFIVPAMGSHGGATSEGQTEVLAGYGVTESSMGVPVRASMEVVELPQGDAPCPVFMDRIASEADSTIVVNRVKSHTDFNGPNESGIIKITVIGLGKHRQALAIHNAGVTGLRDHIPICARQILAHGNIRLGIALVENALHETSIIRAVDPGRFFEEDSELLKEAKRQMGLLPVEDLDILLVDEFGKDISGTGMDTAVIGRISIKGEAEPDSPRIKNIILCDLTEMSHGNALGTGLADFITRKVFNKIDLQATTENVITSTFLERGWIPIVGETPQQCFEFALRVCGYPDDQSIRTMRIKNTLDLDHFHVSDAVWQELKGREDIVPEGEKPISIFDGTGELIPF
jgi:hypothetical protein